MNVLALNACTHFTGFVPFSTVDCGDIEAVHFSSEAPAKKRCFMAASKSAIHCKRKPVCIVLVMSVLPVWTSIPVHLETTNHKK